MASDPPPAPAPAPSVGPDDRHPNREPSREHPSITAEDAPTAAPIELDDPPESTAGEEDPGAANDMAADEGAPAAGGSKP